MQNSASSTSNQVISPSVEIENVDYLKWQKWHENYLEELMARHDNDIESVSKIFNEVLNKKTNAKFGNKVSVDFNVDCETLYYIWKDIQLRNQFLSQAEMLKHKEKID